MQIHFSTKHRLCALWVALLALLPLDGVAAAGNRASVQDLHYGEVLFHFYQQDYFNAIIHLLAAQQRDLVFHHRIDGELLLGGMNLSYGLHQQAAHVFRGMLDEHSAEPVRNRAWYYLGKISFQRGYPDEALDYLLRIKGSATSDVQADRQLLLAQVLMSRQRYSEAVEVLADWQGPEQWQAYAEYNRGVALVQAGRSKEGAAVLERVGLLKSRNANEDAIKDKANVALGYVLLEAGDAQRARPLFQRVRLHGPYSNKALLGAGWADVQLQAYRRALTPWTALRERKVHDAAVQESLLALPFAFGKLSAHGRSVRLYEAAVGDYTQEMDRLSEAIEAVQEGKLLTALQRADLDHGMGWFSQLSAMPQLPETRYLIQLMADHTFQEALKNFRDLRLLIQNLQSWANNIGVFADMVASRRARYQRYQPRAQDGIANLKLDEIRSRRDSLVARLTAITQTQDILGLATPSEHDQWRALGQIENQLPSLRGYTRDYQILTDKHRLLKGVLLWQLNDAFLERLWEQRKALNALNAALKETTQHQARLQRALVEVPSRFEGYDGRITTLRDQIERLRLRVATALINQGRYLQRLAVTELTQRKARLANYLLQARFSLARAYDRASRTQTE